MSLGRNNQINLQDLETKLALELKIRDGAENLLAVFGEEPSEGKVQLQHQVEGELQAANSRIDAIQSQIDGINKQNGTIEDHPYAAQAAPKRPNVRLARESSSGTVQSSYLDNDYSSSDAESDDLETTQQVYEQASGLLSSLLTKEPPEQIENMSALYHLVVADARLRAQLTMQEIVKHVMPLLGDDCHKDVRSTAHRLIRAMVEYAEDVQELAVNHYDIFLIRALARDQQHNHEKQQVLRTVRHLIQLSHTSGQGLLSVGVVRAVVALAENSDDRLRLVCLETLAELVVRDIDLLANANGLRVVLQALSDGPPELAPSLAMVFIFIIDRPHLRAYLRPGIDLEIALSGLTEGGSASRILAQSDKMRSSGRIAVILLKSWSGFMYLCQQEKRALKSLVGALSLSSAVIKETMLDTLFEVFRVKTPDWFTQFVSGKRLTLFRRSKVIEDSTIDHVDSLSAIKDQDNKRPNLINHFLALVLLAFVEVGLLDALVSIAEDTSLPKLSKKAALLLGEILQLSNRVLPHTSGSRMQSLSRLFELAAAFDDSMPRFAAVSALQSIGSINRNRARLSTQPAAPMNRNRSNSIEDPLSRGQRQVENSKIRMGMQIDDAAFRNMILETQVMSSKEWNRWNFDVLTDLFEGPLLNPRRMEEAIKGLKFLRRLIPFLHPLEHKYADIANTKANSKYTRFASLVITTLVASPEGIRFLAEDKLLKQIADGLALLDPLTVPPSSSTDNIFSARRMKETLTCGYITLLGILTQSEDGIKLLEKFKIFSMMYHLTDLHSREDITKSIIDTADYTFDSHSRIILSKALTSSYKHVRLYTTHHLGKLIESANGNRDWLIELLVTQLYDTAVDVREVTVRLLESACQSLEVLETVVQLRPTLDHLGYSGAPLLFRFLSTSVGVRYLSEIEYIDRGLDEWFYERNEAYVVQLEIQLSKMLNIDGSRSDEDNLTSSFDGTVPLHFYGELVKTEEGRAILEEKGHFVAFAEFIRVHGMESQSLETITKLKSVLWAVGNVGAAEGGFPFLDEQDIVSEIVKIAQESPVLTVRGTCFHVLGMISTTISGAELLEEVGWQSTANPLGSMTGFCVPFKLDSLLVLFSKASNTPHQYTSFSQLPPTNSFDEREVIEAISKLSNHLVANSASRTLARIRSQQPELFLQPSLYFRALWLLDHTHYRLSVRRYVFELFSSFALTSVSVHDIGRAGAAIMQHAQDTPKGTPLLNGGPSGAQGEESDEQISVSREDEANKPSVLQARQVQKGF